MSTEVFHLFPNLPGEIRLKVWNYILKEPRVVDISCERGLLPGSRRYAKSFGSKSPPPALLYVNRETRYEALAVYQPYFETAYSTKCTYLNCDQDAIRLNDSTLTYFGKQERSCIQTMIIEVSDYSYFGPYYMETLKTMSKLKNLELISSDGVKYSWNQANDQYVWFLQGEFEEAMSADPGWECPRVRIVSLHTGAEMAVVDGGASIPGWVNESVPFLLEGVWHIP
ncbi:hypothetical protein BP6252_12689 [Coleophoma cylindrospora]|uniref:2EXR domain-containing protein n=1 Tax=Coleophoma cylindrospora TaxID=1849047 RepID=A0A3D8QCL4_9HELO|nr:hypothetical protein BP6252_12689 [Coleophoma cylindrospora]